MQLLYLQSAQTSESLILECNSGAVILVSVQFG